MGTDTNPAGANRVGDAGADCVNEAGEDLVECCDSGPGNPCSLCSGQTMSRVVNATAVGITACAAMVYYNWWMWYEFLDDVNRSYVLVQDAVNPCLWLHLWPGVRVRQHLRIWDAELEDWGPETTADVQVQDVHLSVDNPGNPRNQVGVSLSGHYPWSLTGPTVLVFYAAKTPAWCPSLTASPVVVANALSCLYTGQPSNGGIATGGSITLSVP